MSDYIWRIADAYDVGKLARFCNQQDFNQGVSFGILDGINAATRKFECRHSDGLSEDFRFCEVQVFLGDGDE